MLLRAFYCTGFVCFPTASVHHELAEQDAEEMGLINAFGMFWVTAWMAAAAETNV